MRSSKTSFQGCLLRLSCLFLIVQSLLPKKKNQKKTKHLAKHHFEEGVVNSCGKTTFHLKETRKLSLNGFLFLFFNNCFSSPRDFLFFRSGFHGFLVAYWTLFLFFFHLPNRRIGYSWAVGSFTRRFISSLNWKTRTHFYVTSNLISTISSFLYLNWRS